MDTKIFANASIYLNKAGKLLLRSIFPRRCLVCGRICNNLLCSSCALPSLAIDHRQRCQRCYSDLTLQIKDDTLEHGCLRCRALLGTMHQSRFVWNLNKSLHAALLAAKYNPSSKLAQHLAAQGAAMIPIEWLTKFDYIVPIPSSRSQFRRRLFNLPSLFALALSRRCSVPIMHNGLSRVRNTRVQSSLPRFRRQKNMRGAFRAPNPKVSGSSILLVDDLTTTGATLHSAALALCQGGARAVTSITIIRAAE
jgi:ComF family protein